MRNRLNLLLVAALLPALAFWAYSAAGQQPAQPVAVVASTDPAADLKQADALRKEGSFRAARDLYDKVLAAAGLPAEIEQPAKFGRADSLWRERSSQETIAEARKTLERLVEDLPADGRWRAEAAESLGDLIMETNPWDQGQRETMIGSWIKALDYWGHAPDMEAARPRYIALNFKLAENLINRFGGVIPLPAVKGLVHPDILPPAPPANEPWRNDAASWAMRNVLRVSQNAAEKTHAQLLLGQMRTRYPSGNADWDKEGETYLEQAAEARPVNDWTDDAINELAQYYNNHSDYVAAAAQYQSLLDTFQKGQTPFWDQAQNMLDQIKKPQATIGMIDAFAPSSYLQVSVSYRNLKQARLVLRRVQPATVLAFWKEQERPRNGQLSLRLDGEKVYDEPIDGMTDDGKHTPQSKSFFLEPRQPGFYQAEIVADGVSLYGDDNQRLHLFQISALAVAAKHYNDKSVAWVTDAETGKVVPGAKVDLLFYYQYRNGRQPPRWQSLTATTDDDGLAHFDRPNPQSDETSSGRIYVMATYKDQPAWTDQGWFNTNQQAEADQGRPVLYAWTDRPAYRPGDPIHWKAVMRFTQGDVYRLPQAEQVYVSIRDERGNVLKEGLQSFDNYGTLQGDLAVDRSAALGVIQMQVQDAARNQWSEGAQLCRIEEYKLPEFKVAVEAGKEQVKFGAAVKFTVNAEYYFGGPVAGAELQLVVHRNAFWPSWHRPYPYEWLYAEGDMAMSSRGGLGGKRGGMMIDYWRPQEPEAIVLQKTVKLDKDGKAEIEVGALTDDEIKAARDRGIWGYDYRVEARVTDASRREVVANGTVKVARTAFAAYLEPERFVYLPGDKVKIDLKTLDPNDNPVKAEGLVTIYKRVWNDAKTYAQGVKAPGYDDTKLMTKPATTDATGTGQLEFEPNTDGYFYFQFETKDPFGETVQGETTVFVCSQTSDAVGYRSGGVEIILDQKSYKRGETAHAMVAALRPGVAVWLGVEGETVHSMQVVKLDGTVKLVSLDVKPEYEPNVFLTAVANFDYSGFRDQKMLIVPPTRRFLDVKLTTEKTDYKPGEKATIGIEVKDDEGKPVATQLALAVADAATWAIQSDLAPDIRQFFWGHQRSLNIQTWNSAERYATLFWKEKKDKPGDYEVFRREEIGAEDERDDKDLGMTRGAVGGGGRGGMRLAGALMAESAAMPMNAPAAAPAANRMMLKSADALDARKELADGSAASPEPRVRTNFSATAYWLANIVTDADGKATAQVTWPDSLTTWKAVARAADRETRVGQVALETKTNKPIMVRPQVPRFFTQGDQATLSAMVNNNTSATQVVTVSIDAKGLLVPQIVDQATAADYKPENPSSDPIRAYQNTIKIGIPANSQRRVDWLDVKAENIGATTITMTARCPVDSDASSKSYPILEYGIEQFLAQGTTIREKEATVEKTMTIKLPEDRRPGSESLVVHVEPTLARAMVNALPYLADYPYGCVEQTLSRFVPSTIVKKTLDQLGIKNPELEKTLPDMIKQGLDRLYDFQHADGGWAWWKEGDSDPFMTAYVLAGLAQAREAGVEVKQDVLERGAAFLSIKLVNFENEPDMAAFSLYAMGAARLDGGHKDFVDAAYNKLWPNREKLNPYTRALLALACHYTERADEAQTLVRNMRNGIIEDAGNGTAHWGASGVYWRWSEGGIEATAYSLRALLAIDPQNALIDPAMTWLVRNRRGNRWEDTRDTAIVISALADYIKVRGEDKPDWTAEVRVNGTLVKTLTVKPGGVFDFNGDVEVPASLLKTGDNNVVVTRKGTGVLYASAWMTFFNREAKIPEAGNEVFIHRKYYVVTDEPNLAGEATHVRKELKEGDPLVSGQRVEVEMQVEAKNHYEYLLIEDPKAAGMEPVDLQSGWDWGGGVSAHREMRDEKTAFFISQLAEGNHTINYTLRAEVPGKFHALPSQIHAMYVPEIRGNAEGREIAIEDKPAAK